MASRKRSNFETFEVYRLNLKAEETARKRRFAGRILWPSSYAGIARKVRVGAKTYYTNGKNSVEL